MQPPIHVTGASHVDWAIFIFGAVVSLYWLRALRLAREGARRFLRNLLKAIILFAAVMVVLTLPQQTFVQPHERMFLALFIAFVFFVRWQNQKRSRYISKATRRAVIERDLKGEEFDSEKYHVDHVWPFSRGGSHTVDNLRVIERKKNLQKGAKRPRMRDMW